jgi:hypothetical protein
MFGNLASLLLSVCAMIYMECQSSLTTSATLSSVTSIRLFLASSSHCSWAIAIFSMRFSSSLSFAASSYFCFLQQHFSSRTSSIDVLDLNLF